MVQMIRILNMRNFYLFYLLRYHVRILYYVNIICIQIFRIKIWASIYAFLFLKAKLLQLNVEIIIILIS